MDSPAFIRRLLFLLMILTYAQTAGSTPILLKPGDVAGSFSMGLARIDKDPAWIPDATLRVGLRHRLELHAPLALSFSLFHEDADTGMLLSAGVTDLHIYSEPSLLYTPAIALYARTRLSTTGVLLIGIDLTTVQAGMPDVRFPVFLRSSAALRIEMGPFLTWTLGVSYQGQIRSADLPGEVSQSGFAEKGRISIGSVRVTPFEDTPLLTLFPQRRLSVIVITRIDINTGSKTIDTRTLAGLQLRRICR